jgi:hypothetical protein
MSDNGITTVSVMMAIVLSFGVGCAVGSNTCDTTWQIECVSRGVAAYDSKTGSWTWTAEPVKPEAK